MVATWSPAASSGYYSSQTEYYLTDGVSIGQWYCPSAQLGIADTVAVSHCDFEQLFAGIDRGGKRLLTSTGRIDRVPAFDVTLSAPRSISLLWAFGSPETRLVIEQAQAKATRLTLALLEREASYARRGQGGKRFEQVPITAACFPHFDSRPAEHADGRVFADPNLHTHLVILNLATRTDGTVGALHSPILRDWKMAAGATYHATLAAELQAAGFGIDRIGKNGIFEIAGIDDSTIDYFSARRREIENELEEAGTTSAASPRLAAAVTKSTRQHKIEHGTKNQSTIWLEAAHANSIQVEKLEQGARIAADQLKLKMPVPTVEACIAALPNELTETSSVINRRELFRATTAALVGTGDSAEHAAHHVDDMIGRGEFVALGCDAFGQMRYSTPKMIRIEREVVSITAQLATSSWRSISSTEIQQRCRERSLSDEQAAAAVSATANNRVAIIEGAPGAGKTTTLAPIIEAYREAGCRVVGAASAWRIANMLHDDLQIESRAVAAWIEQSRCGQPFLDSSSLLIVDEAGLLSSRDMHSILCAVKKSGAKLLLVGDRDQLQSIGAGPGLALVARAVEHACVSTIVRQHEAWARDAIHAWGKGNVGQALEAFVQREQLVEADGARQAVRTVVDVWEEKQRLFPTESTLLIAKTNAEATAIGKEVRARRQAAGKVYGPSITVHVATASGHTNDITLSAGDKVRFLVRNDKLGVINGTTGTILRVSGLSNTQNSKHQSIEADVDGRRITFSPSDLADSKGRSRLGWAYASTIYGAQGLTVDHAVVLLSPSFDRHDGYVAISRARNETTLVIDKHSVDQLALATQHEHPTKASELTAADRREWLAVQLSRFTPKESTLDVADFQSLQQESVLKQRQHQLDLATAH